MISIIVPSYNERGNISILAKRIADVLSTEYEIIVVDDNSPDKTADEVLELSKEHPIRLLSRENKRGLFSAVVDGILCSKGDVVGVMDADLQHPPELIPMLLKEIEAGNDIVIGSRYCEGGKTQNWPARRKIYSHGARILTYAFFPRLFKVKDPLANFFFFKKKIIKSLEFETFGFRALLEILLKGNYKTVKEMPCIFKGRERGESKLDKGEIFKFLNYLFHNL